jgi:PhoPQ-activated pathogenicity-related protein
MISEDILPYYWRYFVQLVRFFKIGLLTALIVGTAYVSDSISIAQERSPEKFKNADAALEKYVRSDDKSFQWSIKQEDKSGSCEVLRLHLSSQTWQGTTWKHIVYVIKPKSVDDLSEVPGILLISGGSWKKEWPETGPDELNLPREASLLATFAEAFKSVFVIVQQVPFQPMFGEKFEDEIIAETFANYMKTGDDSWPLLLPMVKSAVRAMDASQAVCKEKWKLNLANFTVTGASKRGWTTWLTSSIDPRVHALAPMVIDMLNMSEHLKLQMETWGTYSEQIADYTELQLPKYIDTPPGVSLQKIVDPYQYREKIAQPKLLIFGTNDRYWPLESCNLYWDELKGSKHLLYVPNKGHNADDYPRVIGSLLALHRSQTGGEPLPELNWDFKKIEGGYQLQVASNKTPEAVRAWVAVSGSKDFRDSKWIEHPCRLQEGKYCYTIKLPTEGYVAAFGEAVYPQEPLTAQFCTNIKIFKAE